MSALDFLDDRTRDALDLDRVLEAVAGQALSPLGSEWVRALDPVLRIDVLRERHARVLEARGLFERNAVIPVTGLADLRGTFDEARLEGSALAPERWPAVGQFLEVCAAVARFAREEAESSPRLAALARSVSPNAELRSALQSTFEVDGGRMTDRIRDDASPSLRTARESLRRAEQGVLRLVQRLAQEYAQRGWLQESFSTVRGGRHVFPVRASMKSRLTGIHYGASASGETVYIEPGEVVEATNEVESRREEERREVHRLLRELTNRLRPWLPIADHNLERLGELDGIQAVGRHAWRHGWSYPALSPSGPARLIEAHHPVLHLERTAASVPITMRLEAGDRIVVLSGPNAGGKTTAMKTLGLSVALVQHGLPIPASADSVLVLFSGIRTDIGDSQDLSAGLSTFSGHMRRLAEILNEAGIDALARSGDAAGFLALLDELGTGTDPQEGCALALAILERLREVTALALTTSHLNPVKQWAGETPGVRNASFALDPTTRRPSFRLRLDLPGASEALDIAASEGLPRPVLDRARELVGEAHLRMGELLLQIEENERAIAAARRESEARAKSLAEQEALAKFRAEQLRDERREARTAALEERERLLRETRERLERLIADLPPETEILRRRQALVDARRELTGEQQRAATDRRAAADAVPDPNALRPGARVWVRALADWAELITVNEARAQARVRFGRIEMEVPTSGLANTPASGPALPEEPDARDSAGAARKRASRKIRIAAREAEKLPAPKLASTVTLRGKPFKAQNVPSSAAPMSIDLHGQRVEEAMGNLERFIDQALLAGYPYVRVCHGLGTGRLYKAVHEYLRTQKIVRSYRFATSDEGGAGVTIVEF